jgi:simple sugar transport system permease protein
MHPLILLTIVVLILAQLVLFRTVFGLRLRAVGENPEAADSLGISVSRMRWFGVLLGGAITALGGAWMAFDQHQFTAHMSGGRGYIALAAMIIGKWTPKGAFAACLLFGFAETMQIHWQGSRISGDLLQMIPYLLTLVVLCGWLGRSTPPAAVGVPYEK